MSFWSARLFYLEPLWHWRSINNQNRKYHFNQNKSCIFEICMSKLTESWTQIYTDMNQYFYVDLQKGKSTLSTDSHLNIMNRCSIVLNRESVFLLTIVFVSWFCDKAVDLFATYRISRLVSLSPFLSLPLLSFISMCGMRSGGGLVDRLGIGISTYNNVRIGHLTTFDERVPTSFEYNLKY